MSLNDSVHQLTRPHLKTAPDGSLRHAPALLGELRAAVTPGRNSSGGGGAEGAPIPIDPTALDMLGEIEKEARKDYAEASGNVWQGDLDELLQSYPNAQISTEWEAYLARVLLGWIDAITAYLWPVKPRRKLVGKVCPSCGWATYGEERKTCLSLGCWDEQGGMRAIGTWDIACASCEAEWVGDQVTYLLRALDAPDVNVVAQVS